MKNDKPYSYREMNEAIHRVYGSRYYKIIRYDFLPDANGSTEMHFTVEENPLTSIKVGLNFNSFTQAGLILNLTSRDLVFKESRALVTASLSENPQVYAEYFKYINKNRTARAVIDYYYQDIDFPVYVDFELYETLRSTYKVYDFQLQQNINRFSYFGVGQQFNYSKIQTKHQPVLIYNGKNNYGYSYLTYALNNMNHKYFSTKGWNVKTELGYVYGQHPEYEYSYNDSTVNSDDLSVNNHNYVKIVVNATHYSELNSKFSWSQNVALGYIIQYNPFVADNFIVGGVNNNLLHKVPFVGLNVSEIKTSSIASVQFGLQYKLSKKAYLTGRANGALYNFQRKEFADLTAKDNLLTGYGLSFGYSSPIGPLELTLMYCDQAAKLQTFINIGFSF